MEHLIDPFAPAGENACDNTASADHFVFENDAMFADAQTTETFQVVTQRTNVALFLGDLLDGEAQRMLGSGRKLAQVVQDLLLDANPDHRRSKAETSW